MKNKYKKLTFSALANKLEAAENALIIMHTRPDADAAGSAFSLKLLLEAMGKKAFCICSDELPARLRFLSSQESTLYENIPTDFSPKTVITVDVASPSQLGELEERFASKVDIMIDHHKSGTPFADNYIRPGNAATGEIVYELSREMLHRKKIASVPAEIDYCIYAAISSDTGCFKYSNVTPDTHRRAAKLLASGIDTAEINRLLFDSKSPEIVQAEKLAMQSLLYFCSGKLTVVPFSSKMKKDNGLLEEHIETIVDIARSIDGVLVGVAIKQSDKDLNSFRISLRSNSHINVAEICMSFGGGGHVRAAGCSITASSMDEAVSIIVEAVAKKIGEPL